MCGACDGKPLVQTTTMRSAISGARSSALATLVMQPIAATYSGAASAGVASAVSIRCSTASLGCGVRSSAR